mmetsp:Transcript_29828/g.81863  ORF Transcript_29828/g.81863 Transcript_29828/m.81863 type:complete len:233 (-) Transcript_29828:450-1148(-)
MRLDFVPRPQERVLPPVVESLQHGMLQGHGEAMDQHHSFGVRPPGPAPRQAIHSMLHYYFARRVAEVPTHIGRERLSRYHMFSLLLTDAVPLPHAALQLRQAVRELPAPPNANRELRHTPPPRMPRFPTLPSAVTPPREAIWWVRAPLASCPGRPCSRGVHWNQAPEWLQDEVAVAGDLCHVEGERGLLLPPTARPRLPRYRKALQQKSELKCHSGLNSLHCNLLRRRASHG